MPSSKIVFYFIFLAFTPKIKGTLFSNGTNLEESRHPRVTGRIVKIYSGTKPEPIVCNEEGFKSDPNDCSIFYRCVDIGRGKFSVLRFSCGPGTVYDPDTEVCNHPRSTKRSECNGRLFNKIADQPARNQENEIDNAIEQAPPSPINTFPNSLKTTTKRHSTTLGLLPLQRYQTTVKSIIIRSSPKNHDEICTSDGFIGDTENCRKFYRCVANGRGGFIRYEFYCSESTMWDEDVQGCNHGWAVKRRRCGRGSDEDITELAKIKQDVTPSPTYLPQKFGNRLSNNNNPKITVDNRKSTQASTQRTTHKATTQRIKKFNRQSYGSETEDDGDEDYTDGNDTTRQPDTTIKTTTSNGHEAGTECTSNGFMGDPNDCKKFYRCVDNGRGSYTKYEFTCGDGTVWDSNIEACNHPWAVKDCGGSSSMESSSTTQEPTSTTTKRTTQEIQSTQTTTDSEDEDTGYNQPTSSSTTEEAQTKPSQSSSSNDVCTKSGFVGDKNNCKKFYRCVDNGKGSYTKYEFSCGEGTVWDPKIEGCNHEWAVEECGESSQDINKVESTTSDSDTRPPATDNNDYNTGYGPQESSTNGDTTSSITTTVKSTTSSSDNKKGDKCTKEGFMGDSKDCKKFYRCVGDGKGGYIRYEFFCGDGTVWDSEIDACNHESAVKNCGQSESVSNEPTTSEKPSNQDTTTDKQNETEGTTSGSQSTTTQSSSSSAGSICTQEGFMGDNSDCKKFYRCVDNQRGGYIKYEFTCGEGTVWDQEIQGCNHPSSTKKCGGSGAGDNATEQNISMNPEQEQQSDEIESEPTDVPKSTTMRAEQPSSSKAECSGEGFYGDPDDCKKFYRCVDDGRGGYTKYDFTCGEGTVWDQEIQGCNHASSNTECSKGTQGAQTSTIPSDETTEASDSSTTMEQSQSSQSSTPSINNDKCTSEGFYGNSNDCKKFYRCVSDGKGGYTKYDFSCGQGTIWVQEIQACDHDNDLGSCSSSSSGSDSTSSLTSSSATESSGQSEQPDREDDEYSEPSTTSSSSSSSSGTCTDEGYYGDENNCKQFYRCVDNGKGGYTKYDFACGEGTAWDQDIQGCNHENQVKSCGQPNQSSKPDKEESSQSEKPDKEEGSAQSSQTTESTSTTQSDSGSGSSSDKCEKEGYYGNSQDCKKFYRCVDNGNGGLTKYDFDCGEGTIWDQDVQTCNHPGDVRNPSCKDGDNTDSETDSGNGSDGDGSESSGQTSQTSSTTQSSTNDSSSESSSQGTSNCTDSTKKPSNITCPKAGFYPNPDDCKKFYRCVDWDGDEQRYSVFHFDCGEGTIWDPELETCNYEDSVYPPRDCSSKQSASETDSSSTTTEGTTTESEGSTTQEQTTQEQTTQEQTTQEQTTQEQTTQEQTTQEQTTQEQTTQEQTTQEQTTQEQTTQEQTTQEQTTQEQTTTTTTEGSTTEESTTTTTEQTTTTTTEESTEQSTTEQSTTTTTEKSTTEQSTTEQTTTEQSTTEGSTTEQSTTEESTTEQSTTEGSTTEQSTTEESTTEQSTTEESSTDDSTTEQSSTEESSTESSSNKDCPETDDDQHVYVCPTGFRRHPKYCNLFYQCEEDDDSHEVKVAVFNCPNNTIYDESKTQCVEESEADKKCDGEMAERRRFKRLDSQKYKSPILVSKSKRSCPGPGHYPFEKSDECTPAFLKCTKSKSGTIRGFVYRCPEKHIYWTVSRRCEPVSKIRNCKNVDNSWNKRWEIPLERKNVAK